jgi:hypothetical protein
MEINYLELKMSAILLNRYTSKIVFVAILSLAAVSVFAQDQTDPLSGLPQPVGNQNFTLFDAIETSSENQRRTTNRPNRESRVTTAKPEFTLLGVSRIAGKYSAILKHKGGESLIVKADPGANTLIPGHSDYSIVDVSAASVSIRYPGNNACVEFSDLGVSCNSAANIAELSLANAEPIAGRAGHSQATASELQAQAEPNNGEVIEGRSAPRNPFQALRNANSKDTAAEAGTTATNTAGARFTPRRINPEDVPEGMRIVSTPFGDRLVEQ